MRETMSVLLLIVFIFSFLGWLYLLVGRRLFFKLWYRLIYLRSSHWREFRKTALAAAAWTCQAYGCQNRHILDVHHKSYKRLGHEQLSDVVVLCRIHHRDVHSGKDIKLKAIYQ